MMMMMIIIIIIIMAVDTPLKKLLDEDSETLITLCA